MEKWKVITISMIILLIVGAIVFYIFFIDKDSPFKPSQNTDINILALNEKGNRIPTGYKIYVNGGVYKEGKTLEGGAILEKVPINSSFRVLSYNLENQNYYPYLSQPHIAIENETYRVELKAVEVGRMDVRVINIESERIILNLVSKGFVRDLSACVKWSFNVLSVSLPYLEVENYKGYRSYDKCYDANFDLNDGIYEVQISYQTIGNLNQDDFIEIVFIDEVETFDGNVTEINGKDVGLENLIYNLRF